MEHRYKRNQKNIRNRKKKKRLDKVLILLTGLLVIVTISLYAFPQISSSLTDTGQIQLPFFEDILNRTDYVKASVTMEAGDEMVSVSSFLKKEGLEAYFETDMAEIDTKTPGSYTVEIRIGGHVHDSVLIIADTTPPEAVAVDQVFWMDESFSAEDFAADINDVTPVTITYHVEPDLTLPGTQQIAVLLTDEAGNQTVLDASLELMIDDEPPVIKGVEDKVVHIGESVSYRQGVTVTDNRDADVQLEIDSSAVNLRSEGTYTVIYSAVDQAGNETIKEALVTVREPVPAGVDEERLYNLADDILSDITHDQMDQRQIAKAIYTYTRTHIRYVNESDKSSWLLGADQGLRQGFGDCYNYFAAAKLLMNRAGIENIDVLKTGGGHYWSMINLGDGWYHFDATPRRTGGEFFMLTDQELQTYSDANDDSHIWDRDAYPATPDEPAES